MATDTARPFVHLHLHSQYSLLDGGNRIDRLVKRVKELGMDAVAVTDHGNLFGAVEFYSQAREAGIKPILGIEAYIAPGDRTSREFTGVADGGHHLVLLAEDQAGWRNLIKLSSDSFLNGFYYKPRMDKATLAQWSEGLIAINGHLGSSLAGLLLKHVQTGQEQYFEQAIEEARWHVETFGTNSKGEPRFFIELQRHDVADQLQINPHLIRVAQRLDLPLVCDNDAHFLLAEDYDTHDTLCCISMGKTKQEPNRLRYSRQLYVKDPQQMWDLFSDAEDVGPDHAEQALLNTRRIADRCDVELDFSASHAPVVKIEKRGPGEPGEGEPFGSTAWYQELCSHYELKPYDAQRDHEPADQLNQRCDQALRELAEAGAVWRYGADGITDEIRARLDRELYILADKSISAYFLIVWDFVNEALRRGIPSCARGSGVGTMVGYCLGMSNACPVKYGLLFERFTDPDRAEFPDIDIDICQDGRQEIIEYVRQKYGHVAQIITFNMLKAKAAVRDVGRVLEVPLPEVDRLCKLIGDGLGTTIDKALDQEPDLKRLYNENPVHQNLLDTARKLEGMARHAGVHAAGIIIATQPLENIVPLCKPVGDSNSTNGDAPAEQRITQWDGPTCERCGLLKMDFLGLRTLSVVERARQLIRQTLDVQTIRATVSTNGFKGHAAEDKSESEDPKPETRNPESDTDPLDLDRLIYDDQSVLDLFRRGETAGVFQFESGGMRSLLMEMKPDQFEDLIVANALYRPGPMELIGEYNGRKHGRLRMPKLHPIVEKYTGMTHGVITYQEQVMQLLHELGGVPLREAYTIIKAISKKKKAVIDQSRPVFLHGATEKGLAPKEAEDLFERMLKFSGYGFNKSHSTGYSILAYQTAYLKTHFPIHYMAALLTYESVSTDKVVEYIDECKRVLRPDGVRGIEVRPPCVDRSDIGFAVVYDDGEPRDASHGHIRFGLSAVKGVGEKVVRAILDQRVAGGPFGSLYDFCERVPLGVVNRASIDALIRCGAFDEVHDAENRAAMVEALDGAIQTGQRAAADRDSGQMSFFESFGDSGEPDPGGRSDPHADLPKVKPWSAQEQLEHEKATLGFYLSSHPLDEHRRVLEQFSSCPIEQARRLAAETEVVLGGMLTSVRLTVVKKGRSAGAKMAMITIDDGRGSMDGVVFADSYATCSGLLEADRAVFLEGKVDRRREEPSIVVRNVIPVEKVTESLTQTVRIVIRDPVDDGQDPHLLGEFKRLRDALTRVGGGDRTIPVELELHQAGHVVSLRLDGLRVGATEDLPDRITTALGRTGVRCELIGPAKNIGSRSAAPGAAVVQRDPVGVA